MPNFNDFGCGNSDCKKRFRCDKYVNCKEYQIVKNMDDVCGETGNYDYFEEIKSDYNDSYLELLKMNQDLQERLESREIYLALTREQRDIIKDFKTFVVLDKSDLEIKLITCSPERALNKINECRLPCLEVWKDEKQLDSSSDINKIKEIVNKYMQDKEDLKNNIKRFNN